MAKLFNNKTVKALLNMNTPQADIGAISYHSMRLALGFLCLLSEKNSVCSSHLIDTCKKFSQKQQNSSEAQARRA